MKHVVKLISYLRQRDIQLRVSEGRLHFNAPKGALTPELLERLKEHKQDVIAFLKEAGSASTEIPLVALTPAARTHALSFAQQRLWFIMQMERTSTAYNIPRAMLLAGDLDATRLEWCFQTVVARHEMLRTSFAAADGRVVQRIAPPCARALPFVDLSSLPALRRESSARSLAEREAAHRFDLAGSDLCRVVLLRMARREHHLLVTMHHIVSDAWSAQIMIEEVGQLYTHPETPLPPLAVQYADYSQWQHQWLRGDVLENQLNYWEHQLAHLPSMLILPTDHPYLPVQSFAGDRVPFTFSAFETDRLKRMAHDTGATLFMVLQGLFAVLLSTYSGQDDIVVGTPVANRGRAEIEPLIGFFVNTLVLRNDLSGDPSFLEFLERVQRTTVAAFAHQDVPLEQVIERLELPRTLSFNTPFQVVFALQNIGGGAQSLGQVTMSALPVRNVTAKFDLTLALTESAGGLSGSLEYNTDLFERGTVEEMTRHYTTLAIEVLDEPRRPLSHFGACSPRALERYHPGTLFRRGFLVSPERVEKGLCAQPLVSRSRVRLVENLDGAPFLAAWIDAEESHPLDDSWRHLEATLPDFMMPDGLARAVLFEGMDTRTLPLPPPRKGTESDRSAASPLEELIAQIWCRVLDRQEVGTRDNFFDLGGQSLGATSVVSHIKEIFGIELPLKQLFLSPTVERLAVQVATLMRAAHETVLPPIEAIANEGPLPLSFAQQRLWFLAHMEGTGAAYTIPVALRLRGHLDACALTQALNAVIVRHEALRTTFSNSGGLPFQVIQPEPALEARLIDLSSLDTSNGERAVRYLIGCDASHAFSLEHGPLLRMTLLRLAEANHVLLLNVHHIVADGGSAAILVRELVGQYAASLKEETLQLAPLPIQYRHFALWQRRHLAGETLARQRDYWREQLAEAPELLSLPWDEPRPAVQTYHGQTLTFTLDAARLTALNAFSRQHAATLFMTLLAAFQAFLSRYANQDDICVGTPVANRNHPQLEALIGFFVNTLVMRARIDRARSFTDLLERVRHTALDAYTHQDLPFEQVVEALQPQRDPRRTPLFQVMLSLTQLPSTPTDLPGLRLEALPLERTIAKYDLSLIFSQANDTLVGIFEFNTDLFLRASIEALCRRFNTFLDALILDPRRPLTECPLLSETETRQLLLHWGGWEALPPLRSLTAAFADWAQRSPAAVAVSDHAGSFTYGELDRLASGLAGHLATRGLGPEDRVGVCMARSRWLIVAVLGIAKAGAAYVPLDPHNPSERTRQLVAQVGLALVLAEDDVTADLLCPILIPQKLQLTDRMVVRDWDSLPERLAYVIFTSGSTGVPKAVAISHRALAVNMAAWQNAYALLEHHCHLQMAQHTFDVFSADLARSLGFGARLVLCPRATLVNPADLFTTMRDEQVDFAEFVPAVARELMAYLAANRLNLAFMRTLIVGSDNWHVSEYRQLAALAGPATRVLNGYGVTEATVDNTLFANPPSTLASGRSVPIGWGHRHNGTYVFNSALSPTPPGVVGELFLGGYPVARGYLDRPGLTAQRFLPDPVSTEPGARMYRTGDSVREMSEGVLEFLGRLDQQVKLRGHRIEPAEISAALETHACVRFAVTLLRKERPNQPLLVSYVLLHEQVVLPSAIELREHARARLPAYMVPAVVMVLERMPLSENGKLDTKALPSVPETADQGLARPPSNRTEIALAAIWCEVLGIKKVDLDDNFFALGGHSLLATRVISRIRRDLGVGLSLSDFFSHSELGAMAGLLTEAPAGGLGGTLAPVDRSQPLPLSFAQQRLWFLERMGHAGTSYSMPLAMHLEGDLDVAALAVAIAAIMVRHEALRTVFPAEQELPVQRILPPDRAPMALADLSELDAAARASSFAVLIAEHAARPFSLADGPLFRANLIRLSTKEHGLLINMHHIVSDGWSIGIFLKELALLYRAQVEGRGAGLTPLPLQYADYAYHQRRWFDEDGLAAEKAYWKMYLEAAPALLNLPIDKPRPAVQTAHGANIAFRLDKALSERIQRFAATSGTTLFMLMQSFYSALLARYSGQSDIVIGTPIANRDVPAIEPLIGFFVNTLALRNDLADNPGLTTLAARVRTNTLACFAHGHLPFEQVVELMRPERHTAHTPIFQVMLVMQNTPTEAVALPSLRLLPLTGSSNTAKYDLSMAILEKDGCLHGALNYNTDLFEATTVQRLAGHLARLIEAGLDDPSRGLLEVSILDEQERRFLLACCDRREFPHTRMLHELFRECAERTPFAIALTCAQESLSYRELDERADRLALVLRHRGIGPETPVGLCLFPKLDLITAMLGILKAGAIYLPLDPSYPRERLRLITDDARPALLITTRGFEGFPEVPMLYLDALPPLSPRTPAPPLRDPALPAYIMYTSGSTGRPKGVVITHRNIVRLVSEPNYVEVNSDDRFLLAASIAFDASTFEIWCSLLNGAHLEILPIHLLQDLPKVIAERSITILWLTAQLFHAVVDDHLACLAEVRQLLVGGDTVSPSHVQAVQQRFPTVRLINGYGPTEGTTFTSCCNLAVEGVARDRLAIGRAINNTDVYVMDSYLEQAPIGVFGELWIGGAGLGRCYLGRPAGTAEKFVPHPWGNGERLYRSGDWVSVRADGLLAFGGRIDRQVKIRGYRIELGEIEHAMRRFPDLKDAVVLLDDEGSKQLFAYVIPHGTLDVAALGAHLAAHLPKYMIPAAYLTVKSFPLTRNGKLDTRALPRPQWTRDEAYRPPTTAIEILVTDIWAELLGLEQVGVDANFFELGGHSLLATRVIPRLQKHLDLPIPIAALFQNPTAGDFARYLELASWARSGTAAHGGDEAMEEGDL